MRLKQTGTVPGCIMRDHSLICWFTARIFQVVNRSLLQKFRHIWLILLKTEWPAPAMTGDVASAACKHTGLHCWSCDGRTELTHRVCGAELRATACSLCWNSKGSFGSCFMEPWTRPQPLRQLESTELMEWGSDWKTHFLDTVNFLNSILGEFGGVNTQLM